MTSLVIVALEREQITNTEIGCESCERTLATHIVADKSVGMAFFVCGRCVPIPFVPGEAACGR